jgi:hypothetical protein
MKQKKLGVANVWDKFKRIMTSSMGTQDSNVFHTKEWVGLFIKKFRNGSRMLIIWVHTP